MNTNNQLCVKLIHCGNRNIANPADNLEKSIFFMPMGFFSMASTLKQKGFDVEIIHLDLENTGDIEKILDFDTLDAVGMSCHWANQGLVVIDTARLIKKIKPGVFLFLGGYTASFFANEILRDYPAVDAVIRGDGEIPVVQLCDSLAQHKSMLNKNNGNTHGHSGMSSLPLSRVQNLAWKREKSEIVFNDLSYVSSSREMDQFDFAAVDLLRNRTFYRDLCQYWTKFEPIGSDSLFMLEIGRGCIYTCTTCGGNARAQKRLSNRKGQVVRSIAPVISSIKKTLRFGFSSFMGCFEFEGSDEWYSRLFKQITREKLRINFIYESWGLPSNELIDALSNSCHQALITISPETADLDLRKKNKDKRKFYTNRQLEDCLEYIKTRRNLKVQLYFGYFLPFDTEDAVFETMDYITLLFLRYSDFVECIYMNFNTDPCSSLFLNPDKHKMTVPVCTFDHYIRKLEENYVTIDGERPGMTLLSWPGAMTEKEAVNLANKIYLFNLLFFFSQSISYLLKKVGKSNIIADHLKRIDLACAHHMDFTWSKIKNSLLDIVKIHLPCDREIIHLISKEYEQLVSSCSFKENSASVYICKDMDKDGFSPDETNEMLSKIKNDRDEISVNLTLD